MDFLICLGRALGRETPLYRSVVWYVDAIPYVFAVSPALGTLRSCEEVYSIPAVPSTLGVQPLY